jgi:hypothetical protein
VLSGRLVVSSDKGLRVATGSLVVATVAWLRDGPWFPVVGLSSCFEVAVVQAGSPNFLRLPPLFWVLRNDILEALLHAACDALDHLRRRSAPKSMGPPA